MVCCAVKVAIGIENQRALRKCAIAAAGELMQ